MKGGKTRAPVDLRGLPMGKIKVNIATKASDGRTYKSTRTYRTCGLKKVKKPKEKRQESLSRPECRRTVRARRVGLPEGSWMLDLEDRLDELNQLGLHQRMRMVSGPQGPRVVLDGRPVLLLCSGNALGLADHPKVRQAAADAAMRWGVGAGAARVSCGTMTLHRRLEERLAPSPASARRCSSAPARWPTWA